MVDESRIETEKTKNKLSFFLDSNIILGRVFEHEKKYRYCKRLLSANVFNYTSETVYQEVSTVISRRKKYYSKLINYKMTKKSDYKSYVDSIATLENDKKFLRIFPDFLRRQYPRDDWYGMYRTHLFLVESCKDECFRNEIEKPLISVSTDRATIESVNNITNNYNDSQILVDMITAFISNTENMFFTTNDRKDLINKASDIDEWFKNRFKQNSFFEIIEVENAIRRLRQPQQATDKK